MGAKRTTARIPSEKLPKMGAMVSRSTGTLYRPAVIWSREASPTTSDTRMTGTAPTLPRSRYHPARLHGAPDTAKHTNSVAMVRTKATNPLASMSCSALTFASMSVRRVCFSFSSANP